MHEKKGTAEEDRREGERRDSEKRETATELDEILHLAQQICGRLANEIHGDAYDGVRKVNEMLHAAHLQLMAVQRNLDKNKPD